MRQTLTILLFLTLQATAFPQSRSNPDDVYYILSSYNIENGNSIYPARDAFRHFISLHPASDNRIAAFYWLAEIEKRLHNIDSALLLYEQVLSMEVPDSVDVFYKHNAAKEMASIYIDRKQYCRALDYLEIASNKSFHGQFCGNMFIEDNIERKTLAASCYSGLGDPQRAIDSIALFMFNGFIRTDKLAATLLSFYRELYSQDEIAKEFMNATKTIAIKKETSYNYTYLRPVITLFSNIIGLPVYYFDIDKMTEQQQIQFCIDKFKKTPIYKLAVGE